MKLFFTEEEIASNLNIVEIEDIKVFGEHIEILEDYYILFGKAEIDGEMYTNFIVEFSLISEPSENTTTEILSIDWNEYDFVF